MRYCLVCNKEYLEGDCKFYGESNPEKGMLYCPKCDFRTHRIIQLFNKKSVLCENCVYYGCYFESAATWAKCTNKNSKHYYKIVDDNFSCKKGKRKIEKYYLRKLHFKDRIYENKSINGNYICGSVFDDFSKTLCLLNMENYQKNDTIAYTDKSNDNNFTVRIKSNIFIGRPSKITCPECLNNINFDFYGNKVELKNFDNYIFWDNENPDIIKDWKYMIERVVLYGNEEDERAIWEAFGYKKIREIALNMETLPEWRVRYYALILGENINKFKSYKSDYKIDENLPEDIIERCEYESNNVTINNEIDYEYFVKKLIKYSLDEVIFKLTYKTQYDKHIIKYNLLDMNKLSSDYLLSLNKINKNINIDLPKYVKELVLDRNCQLGIGVKYNVFGNPVKLYEKQIND